MALRLRPLDGQAIVLTGASSAIGLTTTRFAARRGADLVLTARNEGALQEFAGSLAGAGALGVLAGRAARR